MKSRSIQVPLLASGMLLCGMPYSSRAQAIQTADQRIRLTSFGVFSYVRPDFESSPRNIGATAGGEIDGLRLLPHTDIGMDVRYTTSSGNVATQHLFAGGPRVSYNAFRFCPYADYLVGYGRSDFKTIINPAYTFDTTRTRGYGAGFDYRVTRFWSFRADAQRQRWRFSVRVPPFNPVEVGVGVSYRVHFPSRYGPVQ